MNWNIFVLAFLFWLSGFIVNKIEHNNSKKDNQ